MLTHQLLPVRSPAVHEHVVRLHDAATAASQNLDGSLLMSQWISGVRKGAALGKMKDVVGKLSDADVINVAAYMASRAP